MSAPAAYPPGNLPADDLGQGHQDDLRRILSLQDVAMMFEVALKYCEEGHLQSVQDCGDEGLRMLDEFLKDWLVPAAKEAKGK